MAYKGKDIGYESLNYSKALNVLDGRNSRVIGHNTYLERQDNDDISIRHWSTDIVTFRPDGSTIVDLNGYFTVTTKARLRAYLDGVNVWSDHGDELITDGSGIDYLYRDGIVIDPQGEIVDAQPILASKLEKRLGKDIPTKAALKEAISTLTLDQCIKFWKRYRRDRKLIAEFCPVEFLPLTLGTEGSWRDNGWREVVNNRLRKAA